MNENILKELKAIRILLELSSKDTAKLLQERLLKLDNEIKIASTMVAVCPQEEEKVCKALLTRLEQERDDLFDYRQKLHLEIHELNKKAKGN